MRNYLYIILFLLLGTSCISAQKPVVTIHGHAFHLGSSKAVEVPYHP